MDSTALPLRREQGECHACQDLEDTLHQPYEFRLSDLYEAEHDTLSLACDRVSEPAMGFQGVCALPGVRSVVQEPLAR